MAKTNRKTNPAPRSTRAGRQFGEYGLGVAKKLGRFAKRASISTVETSKQFASGVAEGWKEA